MHLPSNHESIFFFLFSHHRSIPQQVAPSIAVVTDITITRSRPTLVAEIENGAQTR
ncbi:hypothetical protein PISMIDRAFT_684105 [Pisolithus microcarpus 441]|uniref:Unplaced genomic scaffold scaffold_119, whole genome shotgun sequence n=1 Tax=Pisolithus microcarpus 441 TaxID=765257 RepID=A0A0C9Y1H9_9AGAM|nr:hypothetical protein PISMIDRAFT_684105 [Pisolithus microcarpus 441]